MSRFSSQIHSLVDSSTSVPPVRPIGNRVSACIVSLLAVVAGVGTARYVALTGTYLSIQYALPTYDGSLGPYFYLGGIVLLGLAVISTALKAGLVPTILLASAPVVGWGINHFASPISPQYAVTYPIEMALLYGVTFGISGYLLGATIRRGVRTVG